MLPVAAGARAYWLKFRQDFITNYMKVNGSVFSGLLIALLKAHIEITNLLVWIPIAIVAQLLALFLDEWRVRRLKTLVAEQDNVLERAFNIEVEDVDADELEDEFADAEKDAAKVKLDEEDHEDHEATDHEATRDVKLNRS